MPPMDRPRRAQAHTGCHAARGGKPEQIRRPGQVSTQFLPIRPGPACADLAGHGADRGRRPRESPCFPVLLKGPLDEQPLLGRQGDRDVGSACLRVSGAPEPFRCVLGVTSAGVIGRRFGWEAGSLKTGFKECQ
jgi:hypothetical protein